MESIISIRNLSKRFGSFLAVDDLNLEVEKGEIFSFLGVNGAGKTTTLKMLAGILEPSAGTIEIAGFDLRKDPLEVKRRTGYIPDRPYLYPGLTGREFLYFTCELYGISGKMADKRIDRLLQQYLLLDRENELISNYSHGMKQRIATCAAMVTEPQLLIVDDCSGDGSQDVIRQWIQERQVDSEVFFQSGKDALVQIPFRLDR